MKDSKCLVSCVQAGLGYDNKPILENFNFEVYQSDQVCVAGENGSGKSTFTSLLKPSMNYINADEIKKILKCSDFEAA